MKYDGELCAAVLLSTCFYLGPGPLLDPGGMYGVERGQSVFLTSVSRLIRREEEE